MKILLLDYFDQAHKWRLMPITFERLSLFVGASGAGKTQILKSILNLKNVCKGSSINGLKWKVNFLTFNDNDYIWEGEFENLPIQAEKIISDIFSKEDEDFEKESPKIVYEKLYLNQSQLVDRDREKILLRGKRTVKLPQEKSAILLLKEEEQISDVYQSFRKIFLHDHSAIGKLGFTSADARIKTNQYNDIKKIRESDESLRAKLYLVFLKEKKIFDKIKNRFIEVFPYVEDLKIELMTDQEVPFFLRGAPVIKIKEKGVDEWIDENLISSGMYRTLLHIGELFLCADGTVILIDEFENSLGINCIDEVTNVLLTNKRNLQFVITSHHPYVINNINFSNWKIVTRKSGTITVRNAEDFNLGKSKHEAFTQLINLDEYSEGIEI